MRRWTLIVAGAFMMAMSLSAAAESVEIRGVFSGPRPDDRATADIPFRHDLRKASGVSFDLVVDDLAAFSGFSFYFHSGDGWYKSSFAPGAAGERTRVRVDKADVEIEGSPAGWRHVDKVRVSGWRGGTNDVVMTVSDLRVEDDDADVLVLQAQSCIRPGRDDRTSCTEFADRMAATLRSLGVAVAVLADTDVDAAVLSGVKAIFFPYNPEVPAELLASVRRFVADGGRIFAAYDCDAALKELLDVTTGRWEKCPDGDYGGFVREGEGLAGQPAFAAQRSWMTYVVEPREGTRVVARWGVPSAPRSVPALLCGRHGAYMGHVWLGGVKGDSRSLMRAVVLDMMPSYASRLDAADAAARRRAEEEAAWVRAQRPGPRGEFRAFWCHSPLGLGGGRSWDESIDVLARGGFNALIVNMLWGGCAAYASDLLPRSTQVPPGTDPFADCLAACRRRGVEMHVWKVCWRLNWGEPESFVERMRAEGRLQEQGARREAWLCPSHPANRDLEVDAMVELAKKGPDGVHFDYIRYPDGNGCWCARCRALFERRIGRAVASWPDDLRRDGALAAEWTRMRCDLVGEVVSRASARIRKEAPGVKVSAAVFGNFLTSPKEIGQDWATWVKRGDLDFVCPMDYTDSTAAFAALIANQKPLDGAARVYPGIGLSSTGAGVDGRARRVAGQIGACRAAGFRGFTVFNFDAAAEEVLPLLSAGPTAKTDD